MEIRSLIQWTVLLAAAPILPNSPILPTAWAAEVAAGERGRIEEIVVRARKRDELLQDTPVSVTALSGTGLRENAVTRLDEIQDLVPNLSFYSGRSGTGAAVFIRGVGQVDPVITFDPGVGIYVDGVYLSRQAGGILNMADVEQVEVLRGPQGTLFGKNTVGGAILVKTARPKEDFEGILRIGGGSFETVRTSVTLNAPVNLGGLEERLFSRFTFLHESSRGYTKNTLLDRYRNDINALGFLGKLRLIATNEIELNVTGNWFRDQTNGKGGRCVVATDPPPLGGLISPGLAEECRKAQPFRFEANTPGLGDIESYGTWGDGVWDLGRVGLAEDVSLKYIASWREQRPRIREDGDGTGLPELQLSETSGDGPFDGGAGYQRQISQELNVDFGGFDDRLTLVAGAFGFWEEGSQFLSILSLPNAPQSLGPTTDGKTRIRNSSWALFGQATYELLPWLSVTGGLRYTEEKKGFARLRTIPPEVLPGGVAGEPLIDADETAVFKAWKPMGSVSLTAPEELIESIGLDHLLGYFTYSEGFKSGGFNGNSLSDAALEPFRREDLASYEIGVKTVALDRRLRFSGSVFYSRYDDIQVSVIDAGASVLAEVIVRNAAEASIRGAELEFDLRPFDGLVVNGSAGFLDTEYDRFENAPSAAVDELLDRSGETFNNVPDFESGVSISYTHDLDEIGWDCLEGSITPTLQHSYRSEVHYQGPELAQTIQRGYHLLHTRLTYRFNDDRSEFSFWGRNLTDEEYFQQNFPTANTVGVVLQYFEAPRSFGVEVSQRF